MFIYNIYCDTFCTNYSLYKFHVSIFYCVKIIIITVLFILGELPIRWMSPEAVQFGVFSIQSDIWSFGITLYEIITFGVFPYNGLGDVEVVERVKRMEFSITEFLPPQALNTVVYVYSYFYYS